MNSATPVRVGVIGTGIMGERHLRVYAQLPGARVVGVFDPNLRRAAEVTRRYGGSVFATAADLLIEVDAVSIASPTSTHAELAHLALERGVHVLLEKPMSHSLSSARRLAERTARADGIIVLVGHIERFNPVVSHIERLIAGQPISAITIQRTSLPDNRCLDSDVIHDLMIHDIDLATTFLGDQLRCVSARGGMVHNQSIDYATARLAIRGGPQVTLIASRVAAQKTRRIDIAAGELHIRANLLNRSIAVTRTAKELAADDVRWKGDRRRGVTEYISISGGEPLDLELQHFLDCVQGRATPLVGIEAGLRAMTYAATVQAHIARQFASSVADEVAAAGA